MKKLISLLLVLVMLLGLCSTAFAATSFQYTDYTNTDWYFRYVEKAVSKGWMNGVGGQDFNPNGTLNRAMFVTILHRMVGTPAATKAAGFSDVAKGAWYENAVNWAAENGVVTGYQDGRFGVTDPLTREQMATILFRFAGAQGKNVAGRGDLTAFTDKGTVSGYATDAFAWAVDAGIITGANNALNPKGTSTRAQAATVLCRFDAAEEAATLTRADLEKAVVELAWSFSMKDNKIQYDSQNMSPGFTKYYSGNYRVTEDVAPEFGTEDTALFSVCSDYTQKVYYNALGERFMGFPLDWVTRCLWANTENVYGKDIVVARYWDPARLDSGHDVPVLSTTTHRKTSAEMRELFLNWKETLRPGDIMVPNGHAMLYIGDGWVLDCWGSKYELDTGVDDYEGAGAVSKLRPMLDCYVTGKESSNSWWFPEGQEGKSATFAILRPIDAIVTDDGDGNPANDKAIDAVSITKPTATRQQYPAMDIDRTVSVGPVGALEAGGTATYSVKIINKTNHKNYLTYRNSLGTSYAGETYKGLVVTETIPAGLEFVSATNGGKYENGKITWTVDVAAGETKDLSYTVKVTAKMGETVVNGGGFVGTIPSNTLTNFVGGPKMTDADKKALTDFYTNYAQDWVQTYGLKITDETSGIEEIYKKVLGKKLELGTAQELFSSIYEQTYVNQRVALGYERGKSKAAYLYTPKADAYEKNPMLVRTYLGGKATWFKDDLDRTNDFRETYLEPGDIVFHLTLSAASGNKVRTVKDAKIMLWLGDSKYALYDTATKSMIRGEGDEEMWKGWTYDVMFALRPTQAGQLEDSGEKVTSADPAQLEAESRKKFPGIEVTRASSLGKFGTAMNGDDITYTVTVKNGGTTAYKGLTVLENVPLGAKLKTAEGAKNESGRLIWTIDVPAGQTTELKYTVTVTTTGGNVLESSGKADNIPTPTTIVPVGKKLITGAAEKRLDKIAAMTGEELLKEMKMEGKRALDQIRITYSYIYNGKTAMADKVSGALRGVGDTRNFFQVNGKNASGLYTMKDEGNDAAGASMKAMFVKGWFGGKEMDTSNALITKETASKDDFMKGDVIYQLHDGVTFCLYVGEGKFFCMDSTTPNGTTPAVKTAEEVLESCFADNIKGFSLMRPSHYLGS